jgi:DNA-binding Lrp family transcriptional regulator
MRVSAPDLRLLAALEDGLPISPRPYRDIGLSICLGEAEVLARLRSLIEQGIIRRFGLVLRHRQLGYAANAMVVTDVPDDRVDAVGERIAGLAFVTLCYERPRRPPDWPYNLFCMIHGKSRETVLTQVAELNASAGISGLAQAVLFSRRCFKQRGARYRSDDPREVA